MRWRNFRGRSGDATASAGGIKARRRALTEPASSQEAVKKIAMFDDIDVRRRQVLLAHPGTQYSYHLARELERRGRLFAFHTGVAITSDFALKKLAAGLPAWARGQLANRWLGDLPAAKVRLHPWGEIRLLLHGRFGGGRSEAALHRRNEQFQLSIPDRDIKASNVVVGYDTSSWLLARRVKRLNGAFILDQSIGHPIEKERIFRSLRDRFPEWNATAPRKSDAHIDEEIEEHELADLVVVPSAFVRRTLTAQGVSEAKIRVIPFGTDLGCFHPAEAARRTGPIVFLFVGSISARKGVPILLEAWRQMRIDAAELWLVGPGVAPEAATVDLPASVRFLGRRSRSEIAELMRRADIFVFPSFFEGLAQVQVEALASGLPVISTIEAGAEDIVRDGAGGFLVPAGDATILRDRMLQAATDRNLLDAMRRTARAERDRLSWTAYGERWAEVLDEFV
ncbi:MAG: glycosyltransferase family 4 protein [Alphaproteobacteria bacterium]|nr:glycosyltransferase family 4 protein [Alphaproteobacteria bacterium]